MGGYFVIMLFWLVVGSVVFALRAYTGGKDTQLHHAAGNGELDVAMRLIEDWMPIR